MPVTILDHVGRPIRLTDERLVHIRSHPEMRGLEALIADALHAPDSVVESSSDSQVRLYYRRVVGTRVGDKFLCVVVKVSPADSFALTAYLTDSVKKGRLLWPSAK